MLTKTYMGPARARAVLSRQETNVILVILDEVGKHFGKINDNLAG